MLLSSRQGLVRSVHSGRHEFVFPRVHSLPPIPQDFFHLLSHLQASVLGRSWLCHPQKPKVCRHRSVSSSSGTSLRPPLVLPLQRNVGEHLKRIPGVTLFNSSRAQLWNTLYSVHDDAHPSLKPLFSVYTPESPDLSLTEYDVSPWRRRNTAKIRGGRPFLFNRSHIGCLGADGYAFLMSARYNIGCVSLNILCCGLPSFCVPFPCAGPVPSLICSLQDFVPIRSTVLQQSSQPKSRHECSSRVGNPTTARSP